MLDKFDVKVIRCEVYVYMYICLYLCLQMQCEETPA